MVLLVLSLTLLLWVEDVVHVADTDGVSLTLPDILWLLLSVEVKELESMLEVFELEKVVVVSPCTRRMVAITITNATHKDCIRV